MIKKLFIVSFLGLFLHNLAVAQEDKFKALFLMKFCDYVQWPGGNGNLVIGVFGSNPVSSELSAFAAQKENIQIMEVESAADVSKCNIVFVPKNKTKSLSEVSSSIGSNSTLLVADTEDILGNGADIGFYLEENKLRFVISKDNIESKNMLPSAKLLSLGKSI